MRPLLKLLAAAAGFVSIVMSSSGVVAHASLPSQTVYGEGLHEMGRWIGQYAFSADAVGSLTLPASLQVEKPTGATTVEAAYLVLVSNMDNEPTVTTTTLEGSSVSFTHQLVDDPWFHDLADVTDIVSTNLNASSAGSTYSLDVTYPNVYSSNGYTGVALTVIWNSTTAEAGTTIFQFGHAATTGDETTITFNELSSAPTGSLLSLGIGWSYRNATEVTEVNVTTSSSASRKLTENAGAYDDREDGDTSNSFITVGGVGDSDWTTSPDTLPTRSEDLELYSLDSFLDSGDTSLTLDTANPSGNDTVFQLVLYVPGVLSQQTVTFDANGGTGSMSSQLSSSATALSSNSFSRDGYVFDSWNTSADGSGTSYSNRASYDFSSDITLYAQWALPPSVPERSAEDGSPGIFLTVTGRSGDSFEGSAVTFGAYAIASSSSYQLTLHPIATSEGFSRVLGIGRTDPGGHLERTLSLPRVEEGSYRITLLGTSSSGARLKLSNHIHVDGLGSFTSVSAENLQPLLN